MKQTIEGLKAFGRFCSHVNLIGMLGLYALDFLVDKLMWLGRPRNRKEAFNSNRIYEKGFGVGANG
jgi:hypothetical protein